MPAVWADNLSLVVYSSTNPTGWSSRFDKAEINDRFAYNFTVRM